MISGILQLDRTLTREIMVPRIDVVAIEVETPLRAALDVMIAGAHSRLPVYEESIDHI
jgi:putative hemolysin